MNNLILRITEHYAEYINNKITLGELNKGVESLIAQALQTQKDELLDWVEREVIPTGIFVDPDKNKAEILQELRNEQRQTTNNKRGER